MLNYWYLDFCYPIMIKQVMTNLIRPWFGPIFWHFITLFSFRHDWGLLSPLSDGFLCRSLKTSTWCYQIRLINIGYMAILLAYISKRYSSQLILNYQYWVPYHLKYYCVHTVSSELEDIESVSSYLFCLRSAWSVNFAILE